MNFKNTESFAFTNSNKKVLEKSSSGGVFSIVAEDVIKHGGVVYGVTFNSEGDIFHKRVSDLSDIGFLRTSKYVQSDLKATFRECKEDLEKNIKVLYVGTPCQIAALTHYLSSNKCGIENLIRMDFVCHGTPNKKYWKQYLDYLENNNVIHKPIVDINFRYKKPSWELFSLKINDFIEDLNASKYMRLFLENYSLTEQCYSCPYKGKNRYSDITLGDFWGGSTFYKDINDNSGTSLIVIHDKFHYFKKLLEQNGSLNSVSLTMATLYNSAYWESVAKPKNSNDVLNNFTFDNYVIGKNGKINFKTKIRKSISSFVNHHIYSYSIDSTIKKKNNKNNTIGIVTLHGYENFGNRLQNYALTSVLRNKGYNVSNVILSKYAFLGNFFFYLSEAFKKILGYKGSSRFKKRANCIKKASNQYEHSFRFYYTHRLKKKIASFNAVIYGSDQIWYHGDHDILFRFGYLGLSNDVEPTKVGYAAGLTPCAYDERGKQSLRDFMDSFKSISLREKDSSLLFNELEIENTVVLDPTLLLDKEDWNIAIKKYSNINIPNEKYLFVYLLGGGKNLDKAKEYAIKHNLELVNVTDSNSKYYIINQFDFINLIKHSNCVYTDSYHCLIFSLLFEKDYELLLRPDSEGRENRFATISQLIDNGHLNMKVLEERKQDSLNFLFNSLKNE